MRVLIACEYSGRTREAFRALGHDSWSCDFLPSEDNSRFHLQQDVRSVLTLGWDAMIAHPDCTYLTNSAEWCYKDNPGKKMSPGVLFGAERRAAREEALQFVDLLLNAPIERIALENPVGAISTRIRQPDQFIQPYEYGEDASKRTALWLKNLPPPYVRRNMLNLVGSAAEFLCPMASASTGARTAAATTVRSLDGGIRLTVVRTSSARQRIVGRSVLGRIRGGRTQWQCSGAA